MKFYVSHFRCKGLEFGDSANPLHQTFEKHKLLQNMQFWLQLVFQLLYCILFIFTLLFTQTPTLAQTLLLFLAVSQSFLLYNYTTPILHSFPLAFAFYFSHSITHDLHAGPIRSILSKDLLFGKIALILSTATVISSLQYSAFTVFKYASHSILLLASVCVSCRTGNPLIFAIQATYVTASIFISFSTFSAIAVHCISVGWICMMLYTLDFVRRNSYDPETQAQKASFSPDLALFPHYGAAGIQGGYVRYGAIVEGGICKGVVVERVGQETV